MPEYIMKFKIPKEQDEFILSQKGIDFFSCLHRLDEKLRGYQKYKHSFKTPEEVIEYVRDFINEEVDLECVR